MSAAEDRGGIFVLDFYNKKCKRIHNKIWIQNKIYAFKLALSGNLG